MSKKYCDNPECVCNNPSSEYYHHLFDDNTFCPYCGQRLVDQKAENASLVSGDANAIQELNSTVGSYNTKNETHNVDSHNVTYVLNGKAADDMSRGDRKADYREFCRKRMVSGVVSRQLRGELDAKAAELELSDADKKEVEFSVKAAVQSKETKELSQVDRMTLSFAARQIALDNGNAMENLPKLEALCDTDDDEVLFYYHLLSVCDSPSTYVRKFENRMSDTYWQSYWAYIAYLMNGSLAKAEKTLRSLSAWDEYPCDNQILLRCSGFIYAGKRGGTGEENIRMGVEAMSHCVSTSALLDSFKSAIEFILVAEGNVLSLSDMPSVNFYLKRIFGYPERTVAPAIGPTVRQIRKETESVQPKTMSYGTAKSAVGHPVISAASPVQRPTVTTDKSTQHFLGMVSSALVLVGCLVYYFVSSGSDSKDSFVPDSESSARIESAEAPVKTSTGQAGASRKPATSPRTDGKSGTTSKTGNKLPAETKTETSPANVQQELPKATKIKSVEEMSSDEALTFGKQAFSRGDYQSAVKGFMKASESGSVAAKYELSRLFSQGLGVSKDLNYAFTLMKAAADAGYTKAYRGLADMYHGGRGVTKDRTAAEYWYGKAADNGDQEARRILNNM